MWAHARGHIYNFTNHWIIHLASNSTQNILKSLYFFCLSPLELRKVQYEVLGLMVFRALQMLGHNPVISAGIC